jgi:hypothetical protein
MQNCFLSLLSFLLYILVLLFLYGNGKDRQLSFLVVLVNSIKLRK